jgi:hypothetical protein
VPKVVGGDSFPPRSGSGQPSRSGLFGSRGCSGRRKR